MRQRWQRIPLAVGALTTLLVGAGAVFASWEPTQPEDVGLPPGSRIIEIRDTGFNPSSCTISRVQGDGFKTVYIVNKTDQPQRVLSTVNNPNIQTDVLQPDERNSGWFFSSIGSNPIYLESDPDVTAIISMRDNVTESCSPAGPTPTPTPTFTPSPTPTMTPTPIPTPEGRKGIFPGVAKDGEEAQ